MSDEGKVKQKVWGEKGRRKISRQFFPRERTHSVLFFVRGKTYSGLLKDLSPSGLGIIVDEDIIAQEGDSIPLMYIAKPEKEYALENLTIVQIRKDYTTEDYHLGIFLPGENSQKEIDRIWRLITEGEKSVPEAGKGFNNKRLPSITRKKHYSDEAVERRLEWLEQVSGSTYNYVTNNILNPQTLAGNIENYLGAVQVPLGIGGPVLVKGNYTRGYIPIPMATTEGALVSSLTRGAYACNLAGGIDVHITRQVMVRAPAFICSDMKGAINLERWVMANIEGIRRKAESVSSVAKLTKLEPQLFGRILHLRFYYSTGDAAGQNMTTACTWVACEWIKEQIHGDESIKYMHYQIDGHMSGDKKANYQNFVNGRGISVVAEVFLPDQVLRRVMHLSTRDFVHGWQILEIGGSEIGMFGLDVNVANVLAAMFIATGQDVACVFESSGAVFKAMEYEGGAVVTLHIPALIIGTVGGGTHVSTQRECLEMMNCYGPHKVFRLAEIIGAACLSLGISTSSAVRTNEYVHAHEKLGRNRPAQRLSRGELTEKFFTAMLLDEDYEVSELKQYEIDSSAGLISTVIQEQKSSVVGIYRYDVTVKSEVETKILKSILKIKGNDTDILDIATALTGLSGVDNLPGLFKTHIDVFGYTHSHAREIELYRHAKPELLEYCPAVYGLKNDPEREVFALLLEDLSGCSHFNTVDDTSAWDERSIKVVIEDLARLHKAYWNKESEIAPEMKIHTLDSEGLCLGVECFRELSRYNAVRYPGLISKELLDTYEKFLNAMPAYVKEMEAFSRTLIHNDFQTRNIALRQENGKAKLVTYDWELAAFHNPQRDLIEFLIFALPEKSPYSSYTPYIDLYFEALERATGEKLDKKAFMRVFYINVLELANLRYNMYLLTHNIYKYDFIERVYGNLVILVNTAAKEIQ